MRTIFDCEKSYRPEKIVKNLIAECLALQGICTELRRPCPGYFQVLFRTQNQSGDFSPRSRSFLSHRSQIGHSGSACNPEIGLDFLCLRMNLIANYFQKVTKLKWNYPKIPWEQETIILPKQDFFGCTVVKFLQNCIREGLHRATNYFFTEYFLPFCWQFWLILHLLICYSVAWIPFPGLHCS